MKGTYVQPPDMKGKKTYLFRCGCCIARNLLDEERDKIWKRELRDEIMEDNKIPVTEMVTG